MVEQDKLFTTKVKHKGVFDFKECYRIAYEWFIDHGYEIQEEDYKEVVGGNGAKEIAINWSNLKPISKDNHYFRFRINTKFHILGMSEVEVEIDGVKQKLNKGQFEFHVTGILEKDWDSQWEKNKFMNYLRQIYDKYIITARIEDYETKVLSHVDQVVTNMKSFLNLQGRATATPILI